MAAPNTKTNNKALTETGKERDAKGRFTKANATKTEVACAAKNSKSKKDTAAEVKAILKAATPQAAQLLIEIMLDEEKPLGTRLDCANKIIERVCGKTSKSGDAAGGEVFKIVLSEEVKKYAE